VLVHTCGFLSAFLESSLVLDRFYRGIRLCACHSNSSSNSNASALSSATHSERNAESIGHIRGRDLTIFDHKHNRIFLPRSLRPLIRGRIFALQVVERV
jgi:hypothetical protein